MENRRASRVVMPLLTKKNGAINANTAIDNARWFVVMRSRRIVATITIGIKTGTIMRVSSRPCSICTNLYAEKMRYEVTTKADIGATSERFLKFPSIFFHVVKYMNAAISTIEMKTIDARAAMGYDVHVS